MNRKEGRHRSILMKAACNVCCHHCRLEEGQTGACRARRNERGVIKCTNYGRLTALALDPIEKKPLARFYPGSMILSVGSYGCSLRCPFCQNYEIASAGEHRPKEGGSILPISGNRGKAAEKKNGGGHSAQNKMYPVTYNDGRRERTLDTAYYTPQELCDLALDLRERGNIGIAFTYNEPLVGWEFVRDTAKLFHRHDLKTVLVSNGMASQEILQEILPYIDAMNIDLKGFTPEFYRDFVGGDLEMVKDFIRTAAEGCHIEITKLIIPDKNDSEEEMRRMTEWIALLRGGRGRRIPLHVSRYFPRYKWTAPATPVKTVYGLADVAREKLDYVYTGNC